MPLLIDIETQQRLATRGVQALVWNSIRPVHGRLSTPRTSFRAYVSLVLSRNIPVKIPQPRSLLVQQEFGSRSAPGLDGTVSGQNVDGLCTSS